MLVTMGASRVNCVRTLIPYNRVSFKFQFGLLDCL